jgi:hypothetical protein
MLKKLHSSIRSLRQAQRQAIKAFRTYDEAETALDAMACDGLIEANSRAKVVMDATGLFHIKTRHN